MAKPTQVSPPFVMVIWDDAWSDSVGAVTVKDAHELHKAARYETRGWMLVDNETGISVFPERCLDEGEVTYRGRTFIPRSLIKNVTPLRFSAPRKKRHEETPPHPDAAG